MKKGNVVSIEDRIPKLKQQRRKKANRRLTFLLLIFFLLIICIVYFQSPFSHVQAIKIIGNHVYSDQFIIKTSGVTKKTNIWRVDETKIENEIQKLPEIKKVQAKVQLPNQLIIDIKELKRVAYIASGAHFYPVLENGKTLKNIKTKSIPLNAPILIGFAEGAALEELLKGLQTMPNEVKNAISEIHYSPKKTDSFHIKLFMNDGFEVSASLRNFSKKMIHYPSIVSQLDPNKKGIIDLEVGSYYKAFETEGEKK